MTPSDGWGSGPGYTAPTPVDPTIIPNFPSPVGVGIELGYASALVPSGARSNTAYADITGLTITFTARDRPVVVKFYHPFFQVGNAGAFGDIAITDAAGTVVGGAAYMAPAAAAWGFVASEARLSLVSGTSYTYKLRSRISAGTYGLGSAAYAINSYIQAVEV
jgi:hypothetical protein